MAPTPRNIKIHTPPAAGPITVPAEDLRCEFDLPSGKHVVIRKGKGRDYRLALMAAGQRPDQYRITFAALAQLAVIDGKRIRMEDIEEMSFDDVQVLQLEGSQIFAPLLGRQASWMKAILPAKPGPETSSPTPAAE